MSGEQPPRVQLLRFALEGERVRKAAAALERESPRLAAALRRAVPFLSRRNVPVSLAYARATPLADLVAELARPMHATYLRTTPGDARGALILDAGAIALLLDGVLGGDGASLPVLTGPTLTAAQSALVGGVAEGIVKAFSDALSSSLGVQLASCPANVDEATAETTPIACVLEFGSEDRIGRAVLLLAKEVLADGGDEDTEASSGPDARIAGLLNDVELSLVAELGRVKMRLREIARLKVGDTLRLDLPVSGTVAVRADGHELLRGRPTTNEGRIAIRIVSRHGG